MRATKGGIARARSVIIHGIRITFERRRYGRKFYTWAYADINADKTLPCVSLGDPWPCANPNRAELRDALNWLVAGRVLPLEVTQ